MATENQKTMIQALWYAATNQETIDPNCIKKRKLNAGISKVSDANLNKIKELCDNNKNPLLRATELLTYGIDLSTSDEGIEYDPINNRITLRFGDFYLIRPEIDLVLIFTKNKINDEKWIIW